MIFNIFFMIILLLLLLSGKFSNQCNESQRIAPRSEKIENKTKHRRVLCYFQGKSKQIIPKRACSIVESDHEVTFNQVRWRLLVFIINIKIIWILFAYFVQHFVWDMRIQFGFGKPSLSCDSRVAFHKENARNCCTYHNT